MIINIVRLVAVLIQLGINWIALTMLLGMLHSFGHAWLGWPLISEAHVYLGSAALMLGLIVLGIVTPIGGWWFNISLGGRRPSEREAAVFAEIGAELGQQYRDAFGRSMPAIQWAVIDVNDYNAMAYGSRQIAVTRGLMKYATDNGSKGMDTLKGILAHELGHIQNGDTRIFYPLLFATWPVRVFRWFLLLLNVIPFVGPFLAGVGISVTYAVEAISWALLGMVSSPAEYRADKFACKLAGGNGLLDFFDIMTPLDVRKGGSILEHYTRSHPPVELRRNKVEAFLAAA